MHIEGMPVIHARPAKIPIRNPKTERVYQVKPRFGDRAHPAHIARVLGDLRIEEDDMQHTGSVPEYAITTSLRNFASYSARWKAAAPWERHTRMFLECPAFHPLIHPSRPAPVPLPKAKSLLILDDEVAYLEFLGNLMAGHLDCPVVTFSRSLAALEALSHLEVGIIATDYYMPQMNGIEFIRRVRKIAVGTPFIIITGHGQALEATDLSSIPEVRQVIHKPCKWQTIAEQVVKHWNGDCAPTIRKPG
jgi:CheY-like chemotaxis protein